MIFPNRHKGARIEHDWVRNSPDAAVYVATTSISWELGRWSGVETTATFQTRGVLAFPSKYGCSSVEGSATMEDGVITWR